MLRKIKRIIKILLVILLSIFFLYKLTNYSYLLIKEKIELKNFFSKSSRIKYPEASKEEYQMVLEIPKINIKKGLYDINSPLNDVSKNILVIKESQYPNVPNSNLILASHSGNSFSSYFRNLKFLSLNDLIYIYYDNYKYEYIVYNIYEVEKTGYVDVELNPKTNILTLITCKTTDLTKQIVVLAKINNVSKY